MFLPIAETISTRPDEESEAEANVLVKALLPLVIVVYCVPALGSRISAVPEILFVAEARTVVEVTEPP